MRGFSRLKHLGDQMNADCLAEKMSLVEAWVMKHTDIRRIQFHIWSHGKQVSHHEVEIIRDNSQSSGTD